MTALEGRALLDHGQSIARRYARRVGPETAEELKAEAIMRALASPPPDGRMEPWLERIYRNLLVDLWRRRSLRISDPVDLDGLPASGTPEDDVLRRERRRVVRASLRSLPRQARRAVLSKYYGEDHDDVAAARLGVAAVTVRTRIHRALARLRERLGDVRGLLPTSLGRLGSHLVAGGVAPAMVIALVVAARVPPAPAKPAPLATTVAVSHVVAAMVDSPTVPEDIAPVSQPPSRARVRKAQFPTALATQVTAAPVVEEVVGVVLGPEVFTVFADPEPPVLPCMVEAPASLLAQIDKTIEEAL